MKISPAAALLAAGVVALAVAPLGLSHYGHFILATTMVYALVALSLNVLLGMAGQISIGHAGFWALGAYASAIAMQTFGVPFLLAIFVGGIVAGKQIIVDWLRQRGRPKHEHHALRGARDFVNTDQEDVGDLQRRAAHRRRVRPAVSAPPTG